MLNAQWPMLNGQLTPLVHARSFWALSIVNWALGIVLSYGSANTLTVPPAEIATYCFPFFAV